MALQKTITLPSGAVGNYIRIGSFFWDRDGSALSVHFNLYADAAHAKSASGAKPAVLAESFARMRLSASTPSAGSTPTAPATQWALVEPGKIAESAIYAAAKTEPAICDLGADILHDAIDV